MFLKLTEEQIMIQTMVRDFAREVLLPSAMERDRTKEFPAENLKKMAELGLLGMMVPPKYNGAGVDTVSYVLALQEIAYACASTAVVMSVQNSIVCETINRFGTEDQKESYLKPLATGEVIGAFALTEPHAGSDPLSQSMSAVCEGDHYILNGTKRFITSGKNAGVIIVTAKTDKTKRHKGISAFIVEKNTAGFSVGKTEEKMGLCASDTTDLHFEDCRVQAQNLLGQEGDGFKIAMTALDGGRIGIASQAVGVAQAGSTATHLLRCSQER
jgi:alkylation response protein AidB-like acyl-CoA dehydrogenase